MLQKKLLSCYISLLCCLLLTHTTQAGDQKPNHEQRKQALVPYFPTPLTQLIASYAIEPRIDATVTPVWQHAADKPNTKDPFNHLYDRINDTEKPICSYELIRYDEHHFRLNTMSTYSRWKNYAFSWFHCIRDQKTNHWKTDSKGSGGVLVYETYDMDYSAPHWTTVTNDYYKCHTSGIDGWRPARFDTIPQYRDYIKSLNAIAIRSSTGVYQQNEQPDIDQFICTVDPKGQSYHIQLAGDEQLLISAIDHAMSPSYQHQPSSQSLVTSPLPLKQAVKSLVPPKYWGRPRRPTVKIGKALKPVAKKAESAHASPTSQLLQVAANNPSVPQMQTTPKKDNRLRNFIMGAALVAGAAKLYSWSKPREVTK